MDISTVFGALVFGLLGLVLAAYLVLILIGACLPFVTSKHFAINPQSLKERWQLSRRIKLLNRVDQLLLEEDLEGALTALGSCFYLGHVHSTKQMLDVVKAHNLTALSRLLAISKRKDVLIPALPELEESFLERARLLALFFDSSLLREKIKDKYKREGKGKGAWDKVEYEKQIQSLREDIDRNRKDLIKELEDAFKVVLQSEKRSEVTYH